MTITLTACKIKTFDPKFWFPLNAGIIQNVRPSIHIFIKSKLKEQISKMLDAANICQKTRFKCSVCDVDMPRC